MKGVKSSFMAPKAYYRI